ncbi:MAG: 1,4-alpha-glucan branching protein GlgB [Chitinophagaceae bacterium]|nr:1,4-alpha-glucan branching protein GlgB [Chitinophagaceae bacterium]MCW5905156.1 1,4-alpha-glucan branching protein GlgB [Chitinophagaceae bacterium]
MSLQQEKKYEEQFFINAKRPVWNYSLFTEEDIINFKNGTHYSLYKLFGNKQIEVLNKQGTYFAVWAPNASYVSVMGNFNEWDTAAHLLYARKDESGIWEGFIPNILAGESYKYHIIGYKGLKLDKGDPYAHYWEKRPDTASITYDTYYEWNDAKWMQERKQHNALQAPWSVYEVHLASWMKPEKNNEASYNTYQQIKERLVPYVQQMGFTHVELMPVMEYPYDGSWGYQGIGYFAPTSRFGTPKEFAALVEAFHQADIGVIVDWVPSHFPYDAHGLFMFDGTHAFEYADMRKGYHPDWNSYVFDYKKGAVKSFLISSARFWCDRFHVDGLRVDAVSSMLRLDYSRKNGQWEPNEYGGNGNLEAIAFVKDLNETLYRDFPDIQTIAEEATDWPKISKPIYDGGLGFGMKWMMGWMHDTIRYFKIDPIYRQFHQDEFTFSMMYFYDENFMLPFSHDEVVHGKSPMIYKMPGDTWQKFANLRLLYTYMFTHPGAKLLFMGNEFAQTSEWNYATELDWALTDLVSHGGMLYCVQKLNELYRNNPALYEKQFDQSGFEWIDLEHRSEAVLSYKRKGNNANDDIIVILNMTPTVKHNWQIIVKGKNQWKEIFNSNDKEYWGTGDVYNPEIKVITKSKKEKNYMLKVNLPALGAIVLG